MTKSIAAPEPRLDVKLPGDIYGRIVALQSTADFIDALTASVQHEMERIRDHARHWENGEVLAGLEAWKYPEVLLNLIRVQANIVMDAAEAADLHGRDLRA